MQILDEEDEEQLQIKEKSKLLKTGIEGKIEFRNVNFEYPSRNMKIYEDLSFTLEKGKKIAFVGQSGCGKSTILELILRFHSPNDG